MKFKSKKALAEHIGIRTANLYYRLVKLGIKLSKKNGYFNVPPDIIATLSISRYAGIGYKKSIGDNWVVDKEQEVIERDRIYRETHRAVPRFKKHLYT